MTGGREDLNILKGIEETATGRQCGEALIMGMNGQNWDEIDNIR